MAGAIDGVVAAHCAVCVSSFKSGEILVPSMVWWQPMCLLLIVPANSSSTPIALPLGVAGNHYTRLYACYCEQFGGNLITCRVIGRCVVRFSSSGRAFALCIPIRSYVQYGNVC